MDGSAKQAQALGSSEARSLWTLEEISRLTSDSGDPAETLTNVAGLIQRRFGTEVCSVYLLDAEQDLLVLSATIGLQSGSVGRIGMRLDEGLVGLVAERREPQVVSDVTEHPRFKFFPEAGEELYRSFLGVPVNVRGMLQGVLVVQTIEPRQFGVDEVRTLLAAAAQLAPVLSDARTARRRVLKRELEQRAKADLLETLAGGIAHELNNKLMPVAGYADLIAEQARALGVTELEEPCRIITDSVSEASAIVQQLLQLSKPAGGERIVCDFKAVVAQSLALVRLRLQETRTRLSVDLTADDVLVNADPGQLKQVFVNVVWNAIDAMQDSEVRTLTVKLQRHLGSVVLSCSDTGAGIPETLLTRIFDPFFTTKGPRHGSGLGLSVCLAIVRQHGGDIRVSSAPGSGTIVHVVLPRHDGPPLGVEPAALYAAVAPMPANQRILVVDDEEQLRRMATVALRVRLGCVVDGARNGLEAMAAMERCDFDFVLSDVRMPQMNGVQLLRWMTTHRPDALARTVFMTGDGNGAGLNTAILEAGRPLLQKPVPLGKLVSVARDVMGKPAELMIERSAN